LNGDSLHLDVTTVILALDKTRSSRQHRFIPNGS